MGCLVLAAIARGETVKVRLLGPAHIVLPPGNCEFRDLPYSIEFTWDRDEPLELDLYVRDGSIKAGPLVDFTLHDDEGKEVPVMSFVSIPPFPMGHISVEKGQRLRIPLFAWNGIVNIKAGHTYTISARLRAMMGAKMEIELVSDTRPVEFVQPESSTRL